VLILAQDTLLLPLRIATSPALLRTYLGTILLVTTSTVLFVLALVAYTSFYYSYIPVRGISVPVYLQFDHATAAHMAIHYSPDTPPSKAWPYGVAKIQGLVSRQKYHVAIDMTVPRSAANINAGNWMVSLEMRGPSTGSGSAGGLLGWDEEWTDKTTIMEPTPPTEALTVLARSRRPAILTYRSWPIEHAHQLLRLPLYLAGWHTESEHIELSMMESVEFDKGLQNVPSSIRIELRSKQPLEVYTASVRFNAQLDGLRWLMYRHWLSSAIIGTTLFWSVEMGVLLFTWAVFTFLFGAAPPSSDHARIKAEESEPFIPKYKPLDADNLEPGTPLSDTSRTFPTLSSQQPLHYTSTSPKSERNTPALSDIPLKKEEVEADDEDDDFVLSEPPPKSPEREAAFTDSGIGTSLENSLERDSALKRRKSARKGEADR
jgi:seipin